MNEFYDFIDGNFSTMSNMPSNFMYQQEAFPQAVQKSIGLPNFNNNFTNMNQNCGMYNPEEGFIRGNMFPNLFDPYKKQQLKKPNVKNEREKMLLDIQELSFALVEINLYLDVNPNDNCMIRKFNEYLEKKNELIKRYEKQFGPLVLFIENDSLKTNPWLWSQTKWPWEGSN